MLHEILLSLSGQPSSLFNVRPDEEALSQDAVSLLPPPEKALLDSLAHLGRLHTWLRACTSSISSSHPSIVCRAVSTAISTEHLGRFQKRILEVEKAILLEDSGYVGGYGIVPLSTIVGEFAPWRRRMEWLWKVVRFIQPERSVRRVQGCTGAALIDYLREESRTGYVDLEETAVSLISTAEKAWMRQLSMWLLYGNLPMFGKEDFFIQEDTRAKQDNPEAVTQFVMRIELLPKFVSTLTASSILFIGRSLNHIRAKRSVSPASASTGLSASSVTLQGEHIAHLSELKSPISTSQLANAINAVRLSLSQTALSKLLPLPKILEVLSLLHDFLLLRRGDFAMALVSHAGARMAERHRRPERKGEGLEGMVIKEGDLVATLSQAWAELYSLQNEEDPVDDELDLARDLVRLSINKKSNNKQDMVGIDTGTGISNVPFDDLLFPTPTSLSVLVQPPLDLFLSPSDITVYSKIHAYLLGIRRAQIRLGDLWKHTTLRRNHPSPWGPPRSSTPYGQARIETSRQRDNTRTCQMRTTWATSSTSLFVLSEIGGFFQGEVVNGSWQHFREWIEGSPLHAASMTESSRPGTATTTATAIAPARPSSSSLSQAHTSSNSNIGAPDPTQTQTQTRIQQHDPEALTAAHRRYLTSITHSLFLTDLPFTKSLRTLLGNIDHFIAQLSRLESIQHNMDLESDEGVVDNLADYPRAESEVWQELRASRGLVEDGIRAVVGRLREIDESRAGEGRRVFGEDDLVRGLSSSLSSLSSELVAGSGAGAGAGSGSGSGVQGVCSFVPRRPAGVDRLLMKLDFGNVNI